MNSSQPSKQSIAELSEEIRARRVLAAHHQRRLETALRRHSPVTQTAFSAILGLGAGFLLDKVTKGKAPTVAKKFAKRMAYRQVLMGLL